MRGSHAIALASVLVSLVLLPACGFNPRSSIVYYPTLTGNWSFETTGAQTGSAPVRLLAGSLVSNGPNVIGVLHLFGGDPACVSQSTSIAVSGKVEPSGDLNLKGDIAGGNITISGKTMLRTFPAPLATVEIVGGACDQGATEVKALQVPDLSGSYSGVLQQVLAKDGSTPEDLNVSARIVQAREPNQDGVFDLEVTLTYTGACNGTYSLTRGTLLGRRLSSGDVLATAEKPRCSGQIFLRPRFLRIQYLLLNAEELPNCPRMTFRGSLSPE
jgi:hypothetical protein